MSSSRSAVFGAGCAVRRSSTGSRGRMLRSMVWIIPAAPLDRSRHDARPDAGRPATPSARAVTASNDGGALRHRHHHSRTAPRTAGACPAASPRAGYGGGKSSGDDGRACAEYSSPGLRKQYDRTSLFYSIIRSWKESARDESVGVPRGCNPRSPPRGSARARTQHLTRRRHVLGHVSEASFSTLVIEAMVASPQARTRTTPRTQAGSHQDTDHAWSDPLPSSHINTQSVFIGVRRWKVCVAPDHVLNVAVVAVTARTSSCPRKRTKPA